jgi:two-component system, NarL family, sensor histidine kinase DevS
VSAELGLRFGLGIQPAVLGFHHRIVYAFLATIPFVLSIAVGLYSRVQARDRRSPAATRPQHRDLARGRPDDGVDLLERERRRWAQELHDETLQGLGGLRMLLSAARRQDRDELVRAIDSALEIVTDEIQKLRNLIVDLRPPELDEIGLEPAIEKLAARVAVLGGPQVTTDIRLDYELERSTTRLTPDIETAVYRVVQEALTNAVEHAAARSIDVRVVESDGKVEARVSDDGVGFSGMTGDEHFGIVGMRERAELIAGRLSIRSSSSGTTVQLVAPAIHSD